MQSTCSKNFLKFEVENHVHQSQQNAGIRDALISDIFERYVSETIEDKSPIVNVLLGEIFHGEKVFLHSVWIWNQSVIYCHETIFNVRTIFIG